MANVPTVGRILHTLAVDDAATPGIVLSVDKDSETFIIRCFAEDPSEDLTLSMKFSEEDEEWRWPPREG